MQRLMLLSVCLTVFIIPLAAQTFEVPDQYRFETEEDYARYEDQVIEAVEWLLETPVGEAVFERQQVSAFLMAWLTGTPKVTVTLYESIITFQM